MDKTHLEIAIEKGNQRKALQSSIDKIESETLVAVETKLSDANYVEKALAAERITTYEHPRGDAEAQGTSNYPQFVLGMHELFTAETVANEIELPIYVSAINNLEYKIFIRDNLSVFTPANEIASAEGTVQIDKVNQYTPFSQKIELENTLVIPANKYLIIIVKLPVNVKLALKIFPTNSAEAPYRHGFFFNATSSAWENQLSYASDTGTRFQCAIKLHYTPSCEYLAKLKVNLPDYIDAVIGDTIEIFYAGIVNAVDIYKYNINFNARYGKRYKNRWIYTPQAGDVDFIASVDVYDMSNRKVGANSTLVRVNQVPTSPDPAVNVLCIGDSLTAGGQYITELLRRLVGTGGTPEGHELTNINLIGTVGSSPNLHEGISGYTYANFISSESPFYNAGTSLIDFTNYCTVNGFAGIDIAIILLGWNELGLKAFSADDHATSVANAKTLIDQLHTDYPSAKVIIGGLQMPSFDGLGTNYGSSGEYWNYKFVVESLFAKNDAYESIAQDANYSGFVRFVNTATQYDNVNNISTDERAVNTRNATTEKYGTNGVHPNENGYYQIADAMYRTLVNVLNN